MAKYRWIHTKIWDDEWFSELDAEAKLFFIYLITNQRASVAGIYTLPDKIAVAESGLALADVRQLYEQFRTDKKVYRNGTLVWVKKLRTYQDTGSATLAKKIADDLEQIPDCPLKKQYLAYYEDGIDPIDTVSVGLAGTGTGTGTGTKRKRVRNSTADKPLCAPVQRLTKLFIDHYTEVEGEPPATNGGRIAGVLAPLVKSWGESEVERRIRFHFETSEGWIAERVHSIAAFQVKFNELRDGPLKPKAHDKTRGKTHWIT